MSRQAAEISYVNDFQLLMWINLAVIPLVFLLVNPGRESESAVDGRACGPLAELELGVPRGAAVRSWNAAMPAQLTRCQVWVR